MADYRRFFTGRFLANVELTEDLTLTIARVDSETIEDPDGKEGPKDRMVIYWKERGAKPMVTCRTNAICIAAMFGDDDEKWPGKRITVFRDETVKVGKENPGGIRVRGAPGLGRQLKITIKLPKRRAFDMVLVDTASPSNSPPADPPARPDLAQVLADNDLTIEDVDRWRAADNKPPVATLTDDQRAKLADFLAHRSDLIDAVRSLIPPQAQE